MNMYGRRVITTDATEINSDNVIAELNLAFDTHELNRREIEYLWDYFKGKQEILNRKKEVLDEMMPYFTENFGNASSFHTFGREAKTALDKARGKVANLINAKTTEIYFTAGGTESDNRAIEGVAFAHRSKGNHIITSKIEHHGVLHICEYLEKHHGFEVTYLDVDAEGRVKLDELEKAIK